MMPWIEPGDEVMVHDPSYPSNFLNPELIGGVTVRVPTYPEDGYHIRIQEYEKRVTSKTKMVLLTNPNNPTRHRLHPQRTGGASGLLCRA